MPNGRNPGTTGWLRAFVTLCLGLLVAGNSPAANGDTDVLTTEERTWLAAHPDVVLGAGEDWVGTLMKDARGNLSGFLVDHLDLLNRKLGTNVRIEVGPWPVIVRKAESGEIDGLTLSAPLDERRKHFLFTEVFHTSPAFICLRTDDLQKAKVPLALDDLRGRRVGYLKGVLREYRALARYPEITAVPVDSYAELSQCLLRGDLDAVAAAYALEYWRASNGVVGMAVTRVVHEIDGSSRAACAGQISGGSCSAGSGIAGNAARRGGSMTITIVIADDHVLFRQGLAALLREQPGWAAMRGDSLAAWRVVHLGDGSAAVPLAPPLGPVRVRACCLRDKRAVRQL